jgi:DNA (cytosine-5)-methyltransferase 1
MHEALTFGSLFSGIGGLDLGVERAGFECRWQVEWDPWCRARLAQRWPDIPQYGDIAAIDPADLEPVDLIVGGFPCQPVSVAGRQLAQSDDRWLWPEFLRVVRGIRPRYVIVENVRNLVVVNAGSAFGEVLGGLADAGYDAEWDVLGARDVGAPHRRERIFIRAWRQDVAHGHRG